MRRVLLLSAFTSLLVAYSLPASALTINNIVGTWSDVIGGSAIQFVTDGAENQVRWGIPLTTLGQSGLGFTGSGGPITIDLDDVFAVGTLRHFNATIAHLTGATSATLTIALDFSDPSGLHVPLSFPFNVTETPNEEPCPFPSTTPCSDAITFPSAFPNQTFMVGGETLTLQLLGFKTSSTGPLVTQFISDEGATNSALLFGRITNSIPEPGTLFLFGSGLIVLASWRRRKLMS